MNHPIGTPILLMLSALFATCAPIARADTNDAADVDTEALSMVESMMEAPCPKMIDALLKIGEISTIVTDHAAFKTQVCQCVVHAAVNDQRIYGLIKAGPEMRALEQNARYATAKILSSTLRCIGSELDSLLINYSLDDGSANTETPPATP